jgi:hypothetical protein
VDEREKVVTNDGFDWLYGEEADGSVVEEPPAIGAVTETGSPLPVDGPGMLDAPFDTPFDALVTHPAAEPQVSAEAVEPLSFDGPAEESLEAPFAVMPTPPPPPVAPTFDGPADDEPFSFFGEPPTASETPAWSGAPHSDAGFSLADVDDSFAAPGPATAFVPPGPAQPQAIAPPPPPPPPAPAASEEQTAVMEAVAGGGTTQIPVMPARGDIIAEGSRKLSVRERLTPAPRGPKTAATPATKKTEKTPGARRKTITTFLLVALSLATTVWRFEPLRERIFGSNTPTEEAVAAQFTPLSGYEYGALPEGGQMMFEGMEKLLEDEYGVEATVDMKLVVQKGREVGSVVVLGADPEIINSPETTEGFGSGLVSGAPMQPKIIGGTQVQMGTVQQGQATVAVGFFVDPDGFLMTVGTMSPKATEEVLGQLVRANV